MSPASCPADHRHAGSTVCYRHHGCRCSGCVENLNAAGRARYAVTARADAYGLELPDRLVDVVPVRMHVERLRHAGMSVADIAAASGVNPSQISALRNGLPSTRRLATRIRAYRAEALLAVTFTGISDTTLVPARPTARRIQALACHGWTQRTIAARAGVSEHQLAHMMTAYDRSRDPERVCVEHGTARAIAVVYDRLAAHQAPARNPTQRAVAARVRDRAAAAGWPTPMDWAAFGDDFDRRVAPRRSAVA